MFPSFNARFYHCIAYTVYCNCLHARLLHVTLNINQSINQSSAEIVDRVKLQRIQSIQLVGLLVCGRRWAGISTPALQPGAPRPTDRIGNRYNKRSPKITP